MQAGTSAALALVLAALTVWGLGHAFRQHGSQPASRPITPDNVARLHLAWSAKVTDTAPQGPIASSTQVFVLGRTVHAYPGTCPARSCPADWIGTSGSSNNDPSFAVGDRLVFMASESLWAFPQECGRAEAPCDPTWTSSNVPFEHFSSVAVGEGMVFGQAYFGDLFAYPEDCTASCRPLWHANTYGNQSAAVVGNGFVYSQNDHALRAFPVTCRRDGGLCGPVWSIRINSLASQPVYADGRVYALRGENEVVAFDADCALRTGCRPRAVWNAPRVHGFAVADDHVYVSTRDQVSAFPTICPRGTCHPVWRTGHLRAAPSTPTTADGLVFFSVGPHVLAMTADCRRPGPVCPPAWDESLPVGAEGLSPPAASGRGVYVLSEQGTLFAFEVPAG